MLDPALITWNTYITSDTNSHIRLLMGGSHYQCLFPVSGQHVVSIQCVDKGTVTEWLPTRTVKYFQKHCNSEIPSSVVWDENEILT